MRPVYRFSQRYFLCTLDVSVARIIGGTNLSNLDGSVCFLESTLLLLLTVLGEFRPERESCEGARMSDYDEVEYGGQDNVREAECTYSSETPHFDALFSRYDVGNGYVCRRRRWHSSAEVHVWFSTLTETACCLQRDWDRAPR